MPERKRFFSIDVFPKEHFQSTLVLLSGTEPTGIKQKLLQRRKWKWFKNQTNTTLQKGGFLMMTLSYHGYIVSIAFLLHSVKGSQLLILAACFFCGGLPLRKTRIQSALQILIVIAHLFFRSFIMREISKCEFSLCISWPFKGNTSVFSWKSLQPWRICVFSKANTDF